MDVTKFWKLYIFFNAGIRTTALNLLDGVQSRRQ